jgi:hypothetical protein
MLTTFGAVLALAFQAPQGHSPTTGALDRRGGNPLDFMQVVWDYNGALGEWIPTIRVTGANVQLVDGSGASVGAALTGKGNLILGYNEAWGYEMRRGSHNLVAGRYIDYDDRGCIANGDGHRMWGIGGAALGGSGNTVGELAVVVGGNLNYAAKQSSVVVGGNENLADAFWATVTGGHKNTASGKLSSVSGGDGRQAAGESDWAAGSLYEDN